MIGNKLEIKKIKPLPLSQRKSFFGVDEVMVPIEDEPKPVSEPIYCQIQKCANKIRDARSRGASVMLIYGAHLIKNGAATFLVRAQGQSMVGSGITDQAVLIVDRSIKPSHNSIVVATLDGEFVCKRLKLKPKMCLMPDNPNYPPIFINNGQELEIVGTVTAAINKF